METMSETMARIAREEEERRAKKRQKGKSKFVTGEGEEGTGVVGKGWGIFRKNTTSGQPRQGEVGVQMGNVRPKSPRAVEGKEE